MEWPAHLPLEGGGGVSEMFSYLSCRSLRLSSPFELRYLSLISVFIDNRCEASKGYLEMRYLMPERGF